MELAMEYFDIPIYRNIPLAGSTNGACGINQSTN